jgi:hypothetical protein
VVFIAQRAVLPGMGIEPGDGQPRVRNTETTAQVAVHDPHRVDHEIDRQPRHHLAQRQMDGDQDDGKLGRPKHHHRTCRNAGSLLRELRQELGMTRLGKSRAVEHCLGDRIGDDGVGPAGKDVGDRQADGRDRCRSARLVRMARLCTHR